MSVSILKEDRIMYFAALNQEKLHLKELRKWLEIISLHWQIYEYDLLVQFKHQTVYIV